MPIVADKDEVDAFLDELYEGLRFLDDSIIALEENPDNHEILEEIFRTAHTMKGNAGFLSLSNLVSLGHAMESVFMEFQKGKLPITTNVISTLLECKDRISEIGQLISERGEPTSVETESLVAKVEALLKEKPQNLYSNPGVVKGSVHDDFEEMEYVPNAILIRVWVSPNEQAPAIRAFLVKNRIADIGSILSTIPEESQWEEPVFTGSEDKEIRFWVKTTVPKEEIPEAIKVDLLEKIDVLDEEDVKHLMGVRNGDEKSSRKEGGVKEDVSTSDTIRIPVSRLDRLMNYIGELVIANSGLSQLHDKILEFSQLQEISKELAERNKEIFRISADIQELVMKSRLVPIGQVFNRFKRFVRDYAIRADKKINLITTGEDTEIDKKIVDEIIKPLTHIVRNSVDHGIEKASDRVENGKPKAGTLKLHASQEGNFINIIVTDDGKGLDFKKILAKALEKNIITKEEAMVMNKDQIQNLIFHSGLSTKEEVSDISGRGIGMDVVKHSIEILNGTIDLDSEPGKGTRLLIKLPLTLAIINALIVDVEDEIFSIPMASIVETQIIPAENIIMVDGNEMIRLRNSLIPLLRPNKIFEIVGKTQQQKYPVIVVEFNNNLVGILVNRFLTRQEMVIKSLTDNYRQIEGISGASILGDGSIILILDVHGIIQLHRNRFNQGSFSSLDPSARMILDIPQAEKNARGIHLYSKPAVQQESVPEEKPESQITDSGEEDNERQSPEPEHQETKAESSPGDEQNNPSESSAEPTPAQADEIPQDQDELIAKILAENHIPMSESMLKEAEQKKAEKTTPVSDAGSREKTSIAIDDTGKYIRNMQRLQKVFEPENFQQLKDWLKLGNDRAILGIKALTGSRDIHLKKSKGQRVSGEKLVPFLASIEKAESDLIDFILPILPMDGRIHFILTRENARKMVGLLYREANLEPMEKIELDPILEVTNILGSAYTNSLSQITDVPVEPGIPEIVESSESILEILRKAVKETRYKILYIENQFIWQSEDVEARLLILIPEILNDK